MLFPYTRSWTRRQKWLIVGAVLAAFAICGAYIYGYERYYRGPGQEMLFGTWHGTIDWHGSDAYFQFGADHTFSLWDRAWFEHADKDPEFVTKGRWYAGGRFLYLRFPSEFRPDGPVLSLWHIDDISPQELRMRYWRDGEVHIFHRVHSVTTRASNRTMERTPDRSGSTFQMTSTPLPRAMRGLVRRRSSYSR